MTGISHGLLVLSLLTSQTPLADILQKTGERVQRYADNIVSVVCTETTRQQELEPDLKTAKKKPTELVYDFMIERRQGTQISERRELKLKDGKPVKPGTRSFISGNLTAYTTSLLFLLSRSQANYVFSYAGTAELDGREAWIVDYSPASRQPSRSFQQGNVFRLSFQSKGRIWIDPSTYDVIRLDTHLVEPFEFKLSAGTMRKGPFFVVRPSRKFKVETWDVTIRFRPTSFQQPEETFPLPVSAEAVRFIQGERVPRLRTTHVFTNYKRFTSETKIVQ